jgi:hypothetical protein
LRLEVLEARVLPSFGAPRSYDAGNLPTSVAVGDFNGDGILDLAVADRGVGAGSGPGSVSVLLGHGDGSFQAPQSYVTGTYSISVAVGDFTGDGIPDLAVANYLSNTVSVLLGNGDGTFQAQRTFATASYPEAVAVGDFNGDGHLDLAVANYGDLFHNDPGSVSVLLGNGDGSFQTARNLSAGAGPNAVAVGDFNGDGIPDLAVVDKRFPSYGVSVLLGNGDGSFQTARFFGAGNNPQSVALGDFNGDGIPDLVVADAGDGQGTGAGVSVLLGNGDGSFQVPRALAAGLDPTAVAVADLTSDGRLDLVVANGYEDNYGFKSSVSVFQGNGDGSFGPARSYDAGAAPQSVAVGDFTGDGIPDLAVANYFSNNVSVLLGNGDGSLQEAPSFDAGLSPQVVAVGDFTGDGIPDLVVADFGIYGAGNGVSVLLGNGDGTFQAPQKFAAGTGPVSVTVADFNGDSLLDLAVVNQDGVSVLVGNGDGTFQAPVRYAAGPTPRSVAVGDFNGDGFLDLAVADYGSRGNGTVSVLLGNGDGTFQAARSYGPEPGPRSIAVGDFNGDGRLDLATAGGFGSVSVLLGNGDGTFQAARNYAVPSYAESVAVGDFNGDGLLDLAVAIYSDVSVLLGNGDGTFQAPRTFAGGTRLNQVAVADFNGDGLADLVVVGNSGTRVLVGNGDGSFQTTNVSYTTGPSGSVAVGDFNGDGLPDLAVIDATLNRVYILANDGNWNGPSPQGSRPPGRDLAGFGSGVGSLPLPEARWTNPAPFGALPLNPGRYRPTPEGMAGSSAAFQPVSAPRPVATLRPVGGADVLEVDWGLPDWRWGVPGTGVIGLTDRT